MQHPEAAAYHHHYTMLEARRGEAFAAFRQAYHLPLQGAFANCLIYTCQPGEHTCKAFEANALIKQLNLPLFAQATTINAKNTFTVQFAEEHE